MQRSRRVAYIQLPAEMVRELLGLPATCSLRSLVLDDATDAVQLVVDDPLLDELPVTSSPILVSFPSPAGYEAHRRGSDLTKIISAELATWFNGYKRNQDGATPPQTVE